LCKCYSSLGKNRLLGSGYLIGEERFTLLCSVFILQMLNNCLLMSYAQLNRPFYRYVQIEMMTNCSDVAVVLYSCTLSFPLLQIVANFFVVVGCGASLSY